jgi:hypothetical protein
VVTFDHVLRTTTLEARDLEKLVNIEHFQTKQVWHDAVMKKALWFPLVIRVRCRTHGATSGEKCELVSGQLRNGPHADRRWAAPDQVETLCSSEDQARANPDFNSPLLA